MADSTQEKTGRSRTYRPLHRKWPKPARKALWILMIFELIGLVPLLVVFGISQPDLYRSQMWKIGWDNRLNSNPDMIIYAIVNFEPVPAVPLVWSNT